MAKLTTLTVKTTGEVETRDWVDRTPDLKFMQTAVGGYIEVVPLLDLVEHDGTIHKCVAFCDEDGKRKQKDLNREATLRWYRGLEGKGFNPRRQHLDVLVGDVLFIWGDKSLMDQL
ncbi:DUF3846 domain-containing protein [Pseudaminobacter sp. 19-2017]|uniref:DUF3846 domain-containing protein n=1 Tax=Pseudaminobacter soli (ex Zhang et al. 2022) TaxID=2831468 RepID=A0A942DWC4_9HYPH|nr:DUF3846 domain-containing protein [Pseudaminobacter soli]MBS3648834.1 DUF3846 domain-containing protein [Pseudaminobacter soli]